MTNWTPYVGQRVRCISPDGNWLEKDRVYTIQEMFRETRLPGQPYLIGVNVMRGMLWGQFRFEPATV